MNKICLRIKCTDLPSYDVLSKSDPFVVVSEYNEKKRTYTQIGNTESIKNNNSPTFVKTVAIDYIPSKNKKLRLEIFDKDCNSNKLRNHDYFGQATFSLFDILRGEQKQPITNRTNKSHIKNSRLKTSLVYVTAEPFRKSDSLITLRLRGIKLKKKDLFSSDPFFVIYRRLFGEWACVYKSEVIKKNLNPFWEEAKLDSLELCGNDYNERLKLECYDFDKHSRNDLIGSFEFSCGELIPNARFTLMKVPKHKKPQGFIEVNSVRKEKQYCFEDFARAGLEVSTIVAIDFSAQNGQKHLPNSLHSVNSFNEYESALKTCFGAIQRVDSDQMIPVWGFSAAVGTDVSHCFSLTFDPKMPKVNGLQQLLATYRNALSQVRLSQPRILSELLRTTQILVSQKVSAHCNSNSYFVLFIFVCQGAINDLIRVKDLIIELSEMPLTVIFVGVGAGNFSQLAFLDDGWRKFRSSYGKSCYRDSVKLIRFRDFVNEGNNAQISDLLINEVYKTISEQSVEYFKIKRISPFHNAGLNYNNFNSQGSFVSPIAMGSNMAPNAAMGINSMAGNFNSFANSNPMAASNSNFYGNPMTQPPMGLSPHQMGTRTPAPNQMYNPHYQQGQGDFNSASRPFQQNTNAQSYFRGHGIPNENQQSRLGGNPLEQANALSGYSDHRNSRHLPAKNEEDDLVGEMKSLNMGNPLGGTTDDANYR